MFQKLLSNLPYNPSLISQVMFYARRLHSEASLRRLGFGLIILAMIVQVFAVIAPPEETLALSNNDIVRGGFSSKEQAVQLCRSNAQDFGTILAHFGITCDNLAGGQVETIRSTDQNGQLYSMGRLPYGKPNEVEVKVRGLNGSFYMRPLSSWDSGPYSTYQVLSVGNIFAVHYYILFSCGNIVQTGKPEPPPAPAPPPKPTPAPTPTPSPKPSTPTPTTPVDVCPQLPGKQTSESECIPCEGAENINDTSVCLVLSKKARNVSRGVSNADGTTAEAGNTIIYTLSVRNTGKVKIDDFIVEENISDILQYADATNLHGGSKDDNDIVRWPKTDIGPGNTISKQLTIRIKDPIPSTPVSASDPASFDMTLTNVYGNVVNIGLPPTIVKTTEQVARVLPDTGPGTSLFIGFSITVFIGYFFARTRLLAKELDIVRSEYAQGGA